MGPDQNMLVRTLIRAFMDRIYITIVWSCFDANVSRKYPEPRWIITLNAVGNLEFLGGFLHRFAPAHSNQFKGSISLKIATLLSKKVLKNIFIHSLNVAPYSL